MVEKITVNCQSSIRIEDEKIIYFDPYNINEEQHDADLIFITHDHYDHFDSKSIEKVIKDETIVVVLNSIAVKVLAQGISNKQLRGVDADQKYNIIGYEVEVVKAYNVNKNFHSKQNGYVGYIININNERIYVAGDTDINDDIEQVNCDIALFPIGGTYTCDYKEAAAFINKIKPKIVIPIHYGSIVGEIEDGVKFKNLLDKEIECVLKIK